jgi:alkylation response protein AidB-like acyl-CoA dehydrogenase
MDFQPSDDQEELRHSVRRVLRQACPPALVRQVVEAGDGGHDPAAGDLWKQMTRLDWPALSIAEDFGGLGLGFVELSMVVEELGRAVAPSPFVATVTQFAAVVREAGTPEQADAYLRPVAEGRRTGTLALAEPSGRWEPESVQATARRRGSGWVIDGRKCWVFDGTTADDIAVVARAEGTSGPEGIGVFVVPAGQVRATPTAVLDRTQPLAEVAFEGVEVGADGVLSAPVGTGGYRAVTRAVEEATASLAAGITGTCRAIFETTLQYAKDREQYGRPIGSFQALKHRLVDMYLALERSAALCAFAALTIAEEDDRRSLAASMAKAAAGDCQRLVVRDGLQLHGGIGFTWENDLHMFLKRAKSGDFLFGSGRAHRAAVARGLQVWP